MRKKLIRKWNSVRKGSESESEDWRPANVILIHKQINFNGIG